MVVTQGYSTTERDWIHGRTAYTLAEAMVTLLIVSVMIVAALRTVAQSARTQQVQMRQSRATALANDLLAEILHARYADPTDELNWGTEPDESGSSRQSFDDVDDYDGWSASPPEMKDGTPIEGYDGWTREVVVRYADPTNPDVGTALDSGIKRIIVTVTGDTGEEATLVALRSKDGAYDDEPVASGPLIGSVSLSLEAGDDGTVVVTGTNLLNEVEGEPSAATASNNNPPQAAATASPSTGGAPLTVWFSASGCTDPDAGDSLTYAWDFGDGYTGAMVAARHTYWTTGTYTVTLVVSDEAGATDAVSLTIVVGSV
jgi:PKD repeat protein